MSTIKTVWLIIAKSNLHVGNESVDNYNLIDKAIQRDPVTNLPCINSSSLKGAINEYFTTGPNQLDKETRLTVFGTDRAGELTEEVEMKDEKGDQVKKKRLKTQKGNTSFFDANLLAYPIPDDKELYKMITCDSVLMHFCNRLKTFGFEINIEKLKKEIMNACGGRQLHSQTFSDFNEKTSDYELPIIARNCLDKNGNLWYEQVLPRETILGTFILSESTVLPDSMNGKLIQVGANATIGYGYCKFIQIAKMIKESHEK